jgi:hypothetical protein
LKDGNAINIKITAGIIVHINSISVILDYILKPVYILKGGGAACLNKLAFIASSL